MKKQHYNLVLIEVKKMSEEIKVLYIEYLKNDESETLTFTQCKDSIKLAFIENVFFPAAVPVLGIDSITSAYYETSRKVDVT